MLKASDSIRLSPEELIWWHPRREAAYDALAGGAQPGEVAAQLNLPPRTLYDWRNHPFWRDRRERDLNELRRANADRLSAVDELAVRSIGEHVPKSGPVALRYLHLRGLLTQPAEDKLSDEAEDILSNPALFPDEDPGDAPSDSPAEASA